MFKFFNNFINRFDAFASNHIANTKNPSNLNGSNLEYNFALGKEVQALLPLIKIKKYIQILM